MIPIADRLPVRDLVERYALTVDERDLDAAAGLFTTDGLLALPDPPEDLTPVKEHRGRDAVRTALGSVNTLRGTVHEVTAQSVERVGPGVLRGRVSGVAHHYLDRQGRLVDLVWRLRYADEYRQVGGEWLFAKRALTVHAVEVRPVRAVLPIHGEGP